MFQNKLAQHLKSHQDDLKKQSCLPVTGTLTRLIGLTLEGVGCTSPIGSQCIIRASNGTEFSSEVVGFSDDKILLMCSEEMQGLTPGAEIIPINHIAKAPVGNELLGRVLDGAGNPLDGLSPLQIEDYYPLHAKPINPLERAPITEPLDVGVQAINSLLTVGRGQRMGLFAGSGVGKSVLLAMMTRYTTADVVVVGMIGERGREVKEFIEQTLGDEGLARSVVVASPADESPLMRLNGAMVATSIAEYFRDQGKHVLLLMDSLTRFAQAQREIGLAVGEPPTSKGYPPSVFAKLPQLVERAGNSKKGSGSITAFYTVLTEGDDQQDPIADSARAILDGHIVLSRRLAEEGHYPAIDIEMSISRVSVNVTNFEQQQNMRRFKHYYSKYQQNKDMISIGAYSKGSDPEIDQAISFYPFMNTFLQQGLQQRITFSESWDTLSNLFQQAT